MNNSSLWSVANSLLSAATCDASSTTLTTTSGYDCTTLLITFLRTANLQMIFARTDSLCLPHRGSLPCHDQDFLRRAVGYVENRHCSLDHDVR
jgi:hypothetical protein